MLIMIIASKSSPAPFDFTTTIFFAYPDSIQFELLHAGSQRKLWPGSTGNSTALPHNTQEERWRWRQTRCLNMHTERRVRQIDHPGILYFRYALASSDPSFWAANLPFSRFKIIDRSVLRFEIRAFLYLARLWANGGIFSDFTVFLNHSAAPSELHRLRGFALSGIDDEDTNDSNTEDNNGRGNRGGSVGGNDDVNDDEGYSGVKIADIHSRKVAELSAPKMVRRPALAALASTEERNLLSPNTSEGDGEMFTGPKSRCGGSFVMAFVPRDPLLGCILDAYDTSVSAPPDGTAVPEWPLPLCGRRCLMSRVMHCYATEESQRQEGKEDRGALQRFRFDMVDWRSCDDDGQNHQPITPSSSPFFWLGIHATSGLWLPPSASGTAVASSVAALSGRLQRWPPLLRAMGRGRHSAAESDSDPPNNSLSVKSSGALCPLSTIATAWQSCHPFAVDRIERKQVGMIASTALELAAATRCAPTLFLAGAMKAASTWLFDVIASHPQVLRPLEGPAFKESGAYAQKNNRGSRYGIDSESVLSRRLNRFAFIDNYNYSNEIADLRWPEPFISADGSVACEFSHNRLSSLS